MLKHIPFYASLFEQELYDGSLAKTGHLLVYGAIEAHAMGELGCIASNKTIAKETGMKESSVKTVVSVLAKSKWIKVELDKNNHRKRIDPLMVINPPLMAINQKGQNNRGDSAPKDSNKNKKINKKENLEKMLVEIIALVNPKERPTQDRQRLLSGRLKEYSFGEVKSAARALALSEWHAQNGQMSIDNLLRPSKFGRWFVEGQKLPPEQTEEQKETQAERDRLAEEELEVFRSGGDVDEWRRKNGIK